MTERILILTRDRSFAQEMQELLKRFGVEVVDTAFEVKFGELAARCNILLVDKQFGGNAQNTAELVRRIRREFFDPIIGFELVTMDGNIFSLQVAGCNFIVEFLGFLRGIDVYSRICDMIGKISLELEASRDSTIMSQRYDGRGGMMA